MDNLTARIEELNWVLRRIFAMRKVGHTGFFFIYADRIENDIVGRLLALENEAIAREVTNNGRR